MFFRGNQNKRKSKKNKIISLPGNVSASRFPAPKGNGGFPGRAAPCISRLFQWLTGEEVRVRSFVHRLLKRSRRGSLTVEAAFSLPLFFLTLVSLISLLGIYATFVETTVELQQQVEELAMLQVYTGGENALPVQLTKTVEAEMPFLPVPSKALRVRAGAYVLPWTGRSDYSSLEAASSSRGRLYYLSDYKSVYHTSSSCTYLSLQISAMSGSRAGTACNEDGEKYTPCEKCVGHGAAGSVVYVTPNGERYHNDPECSGLKRSVHLVEEDEICGLHMCSRCAKREQGA